MSLSSECASSSNLKNQSRRKFESVLRKKQMKSDVSQEKLLSDSESTAKDFVKTFNEKEDNIELKTYYYNENYLLNKFLGQQSNAKGDGTNAKDDQTNLIEEPRQQPIPKPRKKFSSPLSQNTVTITSPKIVKELRSTGNESPSSNKTYNIEKEQIGNVLIHAASQSKNAQEEESESDGKDKEVVSQMSEIQNNDIQEIEDDENIRHSPKLEENMEALENPPNRKYLYQKITEIIVHKTERLLLNALLVHPVVKVHIVEASTGRYFPKSDKNRATVFFYESNLTDYILPVMTHAFDLQEKRIQFPAWEESILLNEDYEYFKEQSKNMMMFFELLDFLSFNALNGSKEGYNDGWHNIAFAFLKVSGKDMSLNIGKKVRLQFYNSFKNKEKNPQMCNPWIWWKKKKLTKYPSSLYVTVKGITSPTTVIESFRSKTPVQKESSTKSKLCKEICNNELMTSDSQVLKDSNTEKLNTESTGWGRKQGDRCRLPNKCLAKFDSYGTGCFVMKFSHNGAFLACSMQIENIFYVVLYSVLSLKLIQKCFSHQDFIYCIQWSSDDTFLLSASGDNTIGIFNLCLGSSSQILPHPSFVYACDINGENTLVASGCYDGIVRIWNRVKDEVQISFSLFQELEGHKKYVTCVCFSKKNKLYSGDAAGIIIEWNYKDASWTLHRQINFLDVNNDIIINQILLFYKERKLLVHSRDSLIRIIDKKTGCILQWLRGALNERYQLHCSLSPCENFIYSGSEDGILHVWNSKNGHEIASFDPWNNANGRALTIHCVEHHPHDNIVAISHYGDNVATLLYSFDHNIQDTSVNMKVSGEYDIQKLEKKNDLKMRKSFRNAVKDVENTEKLDFKSVLKKMDLVIIGQKQ